MSGTIEAVEADLQHALDQVVAAVARTVPAGSDVIDPQHMVNHWIAQLTPEARARFLMRILSEGSEDHLDGIARAVLAGNDPWTKPEPEVPIAALEIPLPASEPDPVELA